MCNRINDHFKVNTQLGHYGSKYKKKVISLLNNKYILSLFFNFILFLDLLKNN